MKEHVDCIVNAANDELKHIGGIAKVISDAAGPDMQKECEKIISKVKKVPTGTAVTTNAGQCNFKGIIHTVGK